MVQGRSKDELVQGVCDMLTEKGFLEEKGWRSNKHEPYTPKSGFGESLFWLPTENLIKLSDCDISECEDFNQAYQLWGRAGAFTFMPYIADYDGCPSLVIRRNRFLNMFNGTFFQASSTVNGIGCHECGSYRTDFLTRALRSNKVLRDSEISYMLWWASLIDVGFTFDSFRELFYNDISVLNEFLRKSMGYYGINQNRTWEDVAAYIEWSDSDINTIDRKMYQLVDTGGIVVAHMAMGRKTVQVRTAKGLLTVAIPCLSAGTGYNMSDANDRAEFNWCVSDLERNHYLEMILVMAVKLFGINLNFTGWYPLENTRMPKIPAINAPGVIKVSSLNDIYNQEPDEF